MDQSTTSSAGAHFAHAEVNAALCEQWEFELDALGSSAPIDVLQQHLNKAPDPQSATAVYLKGFIVSHAQESR